MDGKKRTIIKQGFGMGFGFFKKFLPPGLPLVADLLLAAAEELVDDDDNDLTAESVEVLHAVKDKLIENVLSGKL